MNDILDRMTEFDVPWSRVAALDKEIRDTMRALIRFLENRGAAYEMLVYGDVYTDPRTLRAHLGTMLGDASAAYAIFPGVEFLSDDAYDDVDLTSHFVLACDGRTVGETLCHLLRCEIGVSTLVNVSRWIARGKVSEWLPAWIPVLDGEQGELLASFARQPGQVNLDGFDDGVLRQLVTLAGLGEPGDQDVFAGGLFTK